MPGRLLPSSLRHPRHSKLLNDPKVRLASRDDQACSAIKGSSGMEMGTISIAASMPSHLQPILRSTIYACLWSAHVSNRVGPGAPPRPSHEPANRPAARDHRCPGSQLSHSHRGAFQGNLRITEDPARATDTLSKKNDAGCWKLTDTTI